MRDDTLASSGKDVHKIEQIVETGFELYAQRPIMGLAKIEIVITIENAVIAPVQIWRVFCRPSRVSHEDS